MQAPESDGQDMVPKICDFGLAIKDSVTEPCVYNGSFPYLAPEVLEKGLVSKVTLPCPCPSRLLPWIYFNCGNETICIEVRDILPRYGNIRVPVPANEHPSKLLG